MIPVELRRIADVIGGELRSAQPQCKVDRVSTDSRGVSPNTLFIALSGQRTDGHSFLREAFHNGASGAIVARAVIDEISTDPRWPLLVVPSPIRSLQCLAKWYRDRFIGKVIAVTGSNGKTITKDALGALLNKLRVATSPGSYNSHLGLPLAVLSIERRNALAVLEAGVSEPGEMSILEDIAAPDYGILINVGKAHLASFGSRRALIQEKMTLFKRIPRDGWVLLPFDDDGIAEFATQLHCQVYWTGGPDQPLALLPLAPVDDGQVVALSTPSGERREVLVRSRSPDIIHDLHVAASAAYLLGVSLDEISSTLEGYIPVSTRTEVWSLPAGVRIVNDSHSSDPISVHSALRAAALGAPHSGRKIFAFAGMNDTGSQGDVEHRQVGAHVAECDFSHLFLVGEGNLQHTAEGFRSVRPDGVVVSVHDPSLLKDHLLSLLHWGDTVLFKGPRNSGMVEAARDLAGSIAQRTLWVDLAAIAENVARFRRRLGGRAKIMAVLKALAYGTELVHLAFWISRLGIDHIGVSSTSEGVAIRKTGVSQDIYVFLPDLDDVQNLVRNRLIPILYSADLIEKYDASLRGLGHVIDVHLKVDTGMHRLGVEPDIVVDLARRIRNSGTMRLTGICTHFASADDPDQDQFTQRQIATFNAVANALRAEGFDDLLMHAANTAATVRFPEAHYNMVRIGIGLYGLCPSATVQREMDLVLAIGLTSRIASIQTVKRGESLGYNRTYIADRDLKVGVVPFGYDDGMPWSRSARGSALVSGQPAPIVGRVSMDQMQVDITDLDGIEVGAPVLLYGSHGGYVIRPEEVAEQAGTMPHELLVRVGKRVTRIYTEP